jgi:hypothetical protein
MTADGWTALERFAGWDAPYWFIALLGALSFAGGAFAQWVGGDYAELLGGWDMLALGVCCSFWLVDKFIRHRFKRG